MRLLCFVFGHRFMPFNPCLKGAVFGFCTRCGSMLERRHS